SSDQDPQPAEHSHAHIGPKDFLDRSLATKAWMGSQRPHPLLAPKYQPSSRYPEEPCCEQRHPQCIRTEIDAPFKAPRQEQRNDNERPHQPPSTRKLCGAPRDENAHAV